MPKDHPRATGAKATGPSSPRGHAHRAETLREKTLSLLRQFNLRVKKELGQNFLIDPDALEQIVEAAELKPNDVVVEVGPGLGVLTRELAVLCGRLVAVELDPKLATILQEVVAGLPSVTIVQEDILQTPPKLLLAQALGKLPEEITSGSYKVVANLPYYITSLVLRHFLEAEAKPRLMVLTVQREVAERLTAKPGDLSLLGVSVQVYGRASIVAKVPAGSFLPTPKVDSAVVRIDVYDRPAVDVDDMDAFFQVVQAGFSQPRKQLHNALSQRIWMPPGKAQELLQETGIDSQRRASTLTLDEWAKLYEVIKKFKEERP